MTTDDQRNLDEIALAYRSHHDVQWLLEQLAAERREDVARALLAAVEQERDEYKRQAVVAGQRRDMEHELLLTMTGERDHWKEYARTGSLSSDDLTALLAARDQTVEILWSYLNRDQKCDADTALEEAGLPSVEGGYRALLAPPSAEPVSHQSNVHKVHVTPDQMPPAAVVEVE